MLNKNFQGFKGHASQAKGGVHCNDHKNKLVQPQMITAHMHLDLALLEFWGNQRPQTGCRIKPTWRSRWVSDLGTLDFSGLAQML